jgi:hypothetical protein
LIGCRAFGNVVVVVWMDARVERSVLVCAGNTSRESVQLYVYTAGM